MDVFHFSTEIVPDAAIAAKSIRQLLSENALSSVYSKLIFSRQFLKDYCLCRCVAKEMWFTCDGNFSD